MSYEIKVEEKEKYVIFKVTGNYELGGNVEKLKAYFDVVSNQKFEGAILDFREAKVRINQLEVTKRPELYESSAISKTLKIAALYNQLNADIRFYETFMKNRSWHFIATTNFEKALDWVS